MKFDRRSMISGNIHSMEIDVTQEQYDNWQRGRMLIQDAMPHLSAEEREFLMTGITPAEWKKTFGED